MPRLGPLAIPFALASITITMAHAAEGAPRPTARALAPAADALLDAGLARLTPALIRRAMAPDTSVDHATGALASTLSGGGAEPWLVAAVAPAGALPSFVFTTDAGLSQAGEVALGWIERARFHGIELTADDAARAFAGGKAPAPAPPTVTPADVRAAWEGSTRADGAPGDERLARAAAALRQRVPALAPPSTEASDMDVRRRVAAELALARGVGRLVAELPARPRTTPVLAHPDEGYYLSPDTDWRGEVGPEPSAEGLGAALAAARDGRLDAHLTALQPTHPQYARLVTAAERYATICASGGWEPIALPKDDKEALEPVRMQALAARLAREGYGDGTVGDPAPEPATKPRGKAVPATFPPALEAAVTRYREERQLKRKSLVDRDLVLALSVPCEERLRTIELNVRRWRHSGWTPTPTWVQVNLAGQEMRFYRAGRLEMMQKTVVGSNKSFINDRLQRRIYRNASPVLMDHIAQVIINPEWNVPQRIAREELEPEIEKDPDYMAKKGFRIVTGGNGSKYYVQAPGPGNALGQIKILFPNSESVYLHDTPGKNAFKLPQRALSHGCVRVDNAMDFGIAILRHDAEAAGKPFDEQWVRARTWSPKSTPITLVNPIPVFLEYYTASVDERGAVWFHPDIYGYDAETFAAEVAAP